MELTYKIIKTKDRYQDRDTLNIKEVHIDTYYFDVDMNKAEQEFNPRDNFYDEISIPLLYKMIIAD